MMQNDRLLNDRLPEKVLFDEVKGLRPPGRPRSSLNDAAPSDCINSRINRAGGMLRAVILLWRDKTCPAPPSSS